MRGTPSSGLAKRRRPGTWLFLILVAAAAVIDLGRPADSQWSTRAAVASIRVYRRTLSPLMPRVGVQCRFTPTCSRYSEAVFLKYGFVRGALLTVRRIARCGPWTPAGTRDDP